ncbi:hypothetical protein BDZ91DRAFT_717278 [Kalaharituber pfeilii]|nr:hypothetical protein BDZ91DRAFT_717278 [Kalaharituber pfeilii]
MKILNAATLLVSLVAGVTNALPTANEVDKFGPSSVSAVDNTHIKHVLDVMEADTGPLNWKTLNDGGALLTIPNDEWDKYANLAGVMPNIQTAEERAAEATYWSQVEARDILRRAGTEVWGGIKGRRTWVVCHGSGSWGRTDLIGFWADHACAVFESTLNSKGTRILISEKLINMAGSEFQIYYRWTYHGFVDYSVDDCKEYLKTLANKYCQGSAEDTRGGRIEGYTGVLGDSWGSKAVEAGADPQALNCNC